jgi:predicted permease
MWMDRQYHLVVGMGRLRRGVSLAEARAQLDTLAKRLAIQYPTTNANWTFEIAALDRMILGTHVRPMLLMLMVAAGCVLLIGCFNVANLLLARQATRQREITIRLAIGCGRGRLIRQLMAETAVLVAGGLIIGVGAARAAVPTLRHLPLTTDLPFQPEFRVDPTLLAAVLAIFALATALAGLAPAWRASENRHSSASLRHQLPSDSGHRAHARTVLTVSELSLTVMLLAGAFVLLRSVERLSRVDLGLAPDHVLTTQITLDEQKYQTGAARQAYFDRLIDRVQSLPGVVAAGLTNYTPITRPGFNLRLTIEGRSPSESGDVTSAPLAVVSPNFFATLRIPLIRGRLFDGRDTESAPLVLIVNSASSRKFFGTDDPI